jgi:hypothetical protein
VSAQSIFPPLQVAIAHAESCRSYLNACAQELRNRPERAMVNWAEELVRAAIQQGELLHVTWLAALHGGLRSNQGSWRSVQEFEAFRKELRALFFTVRETLDRAQNILDVLKEQPGHRNDLPDHLLKASEAAFQLEEQVFRDWPAFTERPATPGALPVDESLAEALGISVEAARQKLDARRQELNARVE